MAKSRGNSWIDRLEGAWLVILLTACKGPDPIFLREFHQQSVPPATKRTRLEVDPSISWVEPVAAPAFVSPQGIRISVPPMVFEELTREGRALPYWVVGTGSETVLLMGGIHGDEQSSSELAFDFLQWILAHPQEDVLQGRRLIVAPLVNPDGFTRGTRHNSADVDLNRNFPASNWQEAKSARVKGGAHPGSEPETRFVMRLVQSYPPSRVVSLHGAAACVNWDGPAEELAFDMSLSLGLPSRASIGYSTPGSFGSWMGIDQRIPTITLELKSNRIIDPEREACREALLNAVLHAARPGVISASPAP